MRIRRFKTFDNDLKGAPWLSQAQLFSLYGTWHGRNCYTLQGKAAANWIQRLSDLTVPKRTAIKCRGCLTCRQRKARCSTDHFHGNDKICKKCQERVTCQVCHKNKHAFAFPKQLLVNATAKSRKTILRCISCMTCQQCGK